MLSVINSTQHCCSYWRNAVVTDEGPQLETFATRCYFTVTIITEELYQN